MQRNRLYKAIASALISALMFGQVGSGFLHNKHDAHETIVNINDDGPVLVKHGEHCKVCSIDWIHSFLPVAFDVPGEVALHAVHSIKYYQSLIPASPGQTSGRAPPTLA